MSSFPTSIIPIGLLIISLALAPWIKLFLQLPPDKKTKSTAFKGSLVTFFIVTIVFLFLLVTLSLIGEYGVYLMMLDVIFGSWLGYVLTQKSIQNRAFGSFVSKKNELLDD